jgi:tRNA nucleotidyltransferase/poly(A) polymerase
MRLIKTMNVMIFKDLQEKFHDLIIEVQKHGGNLIFVGGCVRDILVHQEPKDFDAEVYGIDADVLESLLKKFGPVKTIGKSFGIFYVIGLGVEVALPRLEKKIGKGHKGFAISLHPSLSFQEASSRRDLTINSMGYDPLKNQLLDPWGGQCDLKEGVLRATNPQSFGEDPLRALRVAQFAARFCMKLSDDLISLCAEQDLSELPSERIVEEMKKLLTKGVRPSYGLKFLQDAHLLRFFPELRITDTLLTWVDQGALKRIEGHLEIDFPFMLSLLLLPMADEVSKHSFLKRLGVSTKCFKTVLLFQESFHLCQSFGEDKYRRIAFLFYKAGIEVKIFLTFMEIILGNSSIEKGFESCGAFDREKILPIIKGSHLLKWSPDISPQDFSKILEGCHSIQLQEGIFEAGAIWEQFKKQMNLKN